MIDFHNKTPSIGYSEIVNLKFLSCACDDTQEMTLMTKTMKVNSICT